MLADIVKWGVVAIAIILVIIAAFSLCRSASRFDIEIRKYWDEYWGRGLIMQEKAQKSYEKYRERFANDYGKTLEEATECQAVKNYKAYLEEHYKEYDVVICEKVGD